MAFLNLDQNKLQITVIVGPMESYRPNKKVKQIHNDIQKAKKDLETFVKNRWNIEKAQDLNNLLESNEEEKKVFNDFLTNDWGPNFQKIIRDVQQFNEKLTRKV